MALITQSDSASLISPSRGVFAAATLAELKTFTVPLGNQTVEVDGSVSRGDGLAGTYYWNAADSRADNGTTIIQSNAGGVGRWNLVAATALDSTFTPAGAGAVAHSVQDELRQTVNVTGFLPIGYVTDGSVEYTTQVQAAVNSLSVTGGIVNFPPFPILVDRISVGYSNITLRGKGTASVLLQKVTPSAGPFSGNGGIVNVYPASGYTYPAGGSTITNVIVEDLWLKGQQTISHTYTSGFGGVIADGAHYVTVRRCKFSGMLAEVVLISPGSVGDYPCVEYNEIQDGGDAVGVNKSYGARVQHNVVHDTWTGNGISCTGSASNISHNKVKNTWLSAIHCGGSGFASSVGEENIIDHNICIGASQKGSANGYGIFLSDDGASGIATKTYLVSNNIVDKTNSNIGVFSTLGSANCKIYFSGGYITGTLTAGSIGWSANSAGAATYYVQGMTIIGDANQTFGMSGAGSATVYINGNIVQGHSTLDINSGSTGYVIGHNILTGGAVTLGSKIYPATDGAAFQAVAGLYAGNGVPNNANGANGDFYLRGDGTQAGNTVIYHKQAGSWVALITT